MPHRGTEGPGARAGRTKRRTAPGPSRSSGLRGWLARGLPALAALLAYARKDALATSLRARSFPGSPGVGCLRARGTDSPSQAAQDKLSQLGHPPPPGPRSSRAASRKPGVCVGTCFCVLAPRAPASLPRLSSREALRPRLPFCRRGPEARVGDASGAAGRASPG